MTSEDKIFLTSYATRMNGAYGNAQDVMEERLVRHTITQPNTANGRRHLLEFALQTLRMMIRIGQQESYPAWQWRVHLSANCDNSLLVQTIERIINTDPRANQEVHFPSNVDVMNFDGRFVLEANVR